MLYKIADQEILPLDELVAAATSNSFRHSEQDVSEHALADHQDKMFGMLMEEILYRSWSLPEAAACLGKTQDYVADHMTVSVHQRMEHDGQIIGVRWHHQLFLPEWQFSRQVKEQRWVPIQGLFDVAKAASHLSTLSLLSWFIRPNVAFRDLSPGEMMQAGRVADVVRQVQGVQVS